MGQPKFIEVPANVFYTSIGRIEGTRLSAETVGHKEFMRFVVKLWSNSLHDYEEIAYNIHPWHEHNPEHIKYYVLERVLDEFIIF